MLSQKTNTDPNSTRSREIQELENKVGRTLAAIRVPPNFHDLVRENLKTFHSDYLAALDGLIGSLETLGASISVTFWQHVKPDGSPQKEEPPFATLVATKPGESGRFLLSNINTVLNPIQRDDIGFGPSNGHKRLITSSSDATADPQDKIPHYPLLIEAFNNPVIIAVTTCTGRMTPWDDKPCASDFRKKSLAIAGRAQSWLAQVAP